MLNWYLLYCKRNELERAVDNFNNQNVISYYPRGIFHKKLRGKKVKKTEPLFMNYLFVQFDAEQIAFTTIRSTRGVSDFIRLGGFPLIVAESVIQELRNKEEILFSSASAGMDENLNKLKKGDSVQLSTHGFEHVTAIYDEPDGDKRSILLINILNQQQKVIVKNEDIVKID